MDRLTQGKDKNTLITWLALGVSTDGRRFILTV